MDPEIVTGLDSTMTLNRTLTSLALLALIMLGLAPILSANTRIAPAEIEVVAPEEVSPLLPLKEGSTEQTDSGELKSGFLPGAPVLVVENVPHLHDRVVGSSDPHIYSGGECGTQDECMLSGGCPTRSLMMILLFGSVAGFLLGVDRRSRAYIGWIKRIGAKRSFVTGSAVFPANWNPRVIQSRNELHLDYKRPGAGSACQNLKLLADFALYGGVALMALPILLRSIIEGHFLFLDAYADEENQVLAGSLLFIAVAYYVQGTVYKDLIAASAKRWNPVVERAYRTRVMMGREDLTQSQKSPLPMQIEPAQPREQQRPDERQHPGASEGWGGTTL